MKKTFKYIIGFLGLLLLIYFSIDIQNLDEYRASNREEVFDAETYANNIWKNAMPDIARQAPELLPILDLLEIDRKLAFTQYAKKLGISKTWHFMVQGSGTVEAMDDEAVWVNLGGKHHVQLATSFIFGNTVRDGSGAVNIDDFINMTDFNNVSIALNKLVKTEIIPGLINQDLIGQQLAFAGAFEFNEDSGSLTDIRIIPVSVTIKDAE